MEQSNKGQNSVIFSIAEILGKMSNQVNFLIRHGKLLSQLDVDMLMENTRKLYDTICSVNCNMDVDSIPMEIENNENVEDVKDDREFKMDFDIDTDNDSDNDFDNDTDNDSDNDFDIDTDNDSDNDFDIDTDNDSDNDFDNDTDFDNDSDNDFDNDSDNDSDNDFDNDSDNDLDNDLDNDSDNDYIPSPVPCPQDPKEEDSGIRSYIKSPSSDNIVRTISDKLEQSEDNSLASVLQKKSISDLMAAIDLNDRFMLLNELFDSNMDKYNKSIRALNSFSTLLGAKTYMSELQIEYQWDCESEAYKKLNDLVERRFISIHNS